MSLNISPEDQALESRSCLKERKVRKKARASLSMVVDSIVSFAVERLGNYLIEEAALLQGVKDEVDWLKRELRMMRAFLKDAEEKQDDNPMVREWIYEIRDIAYESEDVLDTFILTERTNEKTKSSAFVSCMSVSKPIKRYNIAKHIQGLKERLNNVSQRRAIYGIRDTTGPRNEGGTSNENGISKELRRSTSYADQEQQVVGFEDESKLLVAQLVKSDQQRCAVSILGMGGLGKTTLARKLYKSSQIQHRFDLRFWVCVSQDYEPKDVLRRVMKTIISFKSFDDKELKKIQKILKQEDLEDMERFIRKQLQEDSYLIVLDDVWKKDAWESLRRAFPENGKRSRIIITTRIKEVAELLEERTCLHQLRFLREEESWELFMKKVLFDNNNGDVAEMEILGREMVKRCGGLPLAIVVLGGLLSTKKTLAEWKILRDHLWKNLRRGSIHISHILSLSYNELPVELKPCFYFLGMYPEDFVIDTNDLIRQWMAEGFIPQEEETMESVGEYYLNNLINRSMLQIQTRTSKRVVKCGLHDLVRDLAIQKAKEENFLNIYDDKAPTMSYTSRRVAIHVNPVMPIETKYWSSSIRTIMLFGHSENEEFIKFICSRCKLLRVLYVQGKDRKISARLNVLNSVHLKYVRSDTYLSFSSRRLLPLDLQTLDLGGSGYSSLVLTGKDIRTLEKLRRMRHLYINVHHACDLNPYVFPNIQSWQIPCHRSRDTN